MTYNKEYIEQLLQRFMDGETTELEEQFLVEYFSTSDSIPEDWEAYREMFASFATDAYDFSEEELIGISPKPRMIRILPWLAAACVAALLIIFMAPPREDASRGSEGSVIAKATKDSLHKAPKKPAPITTPVNQMAQAAERNPTLVRHPSSVNPAPGHSSNNPAPMRHPSSVNPAIVRNPVTVSQSPAPTAPIEPTIAIAEHPREQYCASSSSVSEDWEATIEQTFRNHSAPIRERGLQVIQRVSMLQQEQRNQQQYVDL